MEVLAKSFTGKVVDANNAPIAGATVTINGTSRTTSSTGSYAFAVTDNPMGYHLEVQKNGFGPVSELYLANASGSVHVLTAGNTQLIDPTRSNKIVDRASGIEVSLAANALATTTGAAPAGAVRFTIIPLNAANMPGDFTAQTSSGARGALDTVGAATLQAEDSQGRTLGLASNATMTVRIPVPGNVMPDCVLSRACDTRIWRFDRVRSLWVQAPVSVTFTPTVTTFSSTPVAAPPNVDGLGTWNVDIYFDNPACTIVFWVVDQACFPGPGGSFTANFSQPVTSGTSTAQINDQTTVSVLYNLWPNLPTTLSVPGTSCTKTFGSVQWISDTASSITYDSGAPWGSTGYPQNSSATAVTANDAFLGDHPCHSIVEVTMAP